MTKDSLSLYERLGGEAALEEMLRDFYGRARQHKLLGPKFRIVDDWEFHISKVSFYWRRQTEGPPNFDRNFPLRHQPLFLSERHFRSWLILFRAACLRRWDPPDALELFEIALGTARNLFGKICPLDGEPNFSDLDEET